MYGDIKEVKRLSELNYKVGVKNTDDIRVLEKDMSKIKAVFTLVASFITLGLASFWAWVGLKK